MYDIEALAKAARIRNEHKSLIHLELTAALVFGHQKSSLELYNGLHFSLFGKDTELKASENLQHDCKQELENMKGIYSINRELCKFLTFVIEYIIPIFFSNGHKHKPADMLTVWLACYLKNDVSILSWRTVAGDYAEELMKMERSLDNFGIEDYLKKEMFMMCLRSVFKQIFSNTVIDAEYKKYSYDGFEKIQLITNK